MFRDFNIKPLVAAMIAASLLSACGGGGGGGDDDPPATPPGNTSGADGTGGNSNPPATGNPGTGTGTPGGNTGGTPGGDTGGTPGGGTGGTGGTPGNTPDAQRTTMVCAEGANFQCSGETVLLTEPHGVVLTNSGVQVAARSTSDLQTPNPSKTEPTGMNLLDQGKADIRIGKGTNGLVSAVNMLLSDLGIRWGADNGPERPLIIETFATAQGRYQMNGNVVQRVALPPSSDAQFYNFITGVGGTQANYANNVYYPKNAATNCSVSAATPLPADCETRGLFSAEGVWRNGTGDARPDTFAASRLHNDGDVHAGDTAPDATGNGVPFPGSKGYRSIDGRNYTYANLSSWITQDTVKMVEWSQGLGDDEHNTQRRGFVAFGAVTNPAAVPTEGTATYTGIVYGYFGANGGTAEPEGIAGRAIISVNFATRAVTVNFIDVINNAGNAEPLLEISPTITGGTAGSKFANYLTGAYDGTNYAGGVSARYFGPVITTGTSGAGPAELAGTLRLRGKTGNSTFIGGFMGRKD